MNIVSLAETPLGISREEIGGLFAPFVSRTYAAKDAEWRRLIMGKRLSVGVKCLKRKLLGWLPAFQRTPKYVEQFYGQKVVDYDSYSLDAPGPKSSLWEWGEERMQASNRGATRVRQLFLIRFLEMLRPRRVLEVGAGDGINLILLACYFPDVEFTGIDLSQPRWQGARRLQELPELPKHIQAYAPLPLKDPTAFRRIRFHQGSATELPFASNSFDLVTTVLALEQMERVRDQALGEVARVAARDVLMIEPFRDLNESGLPRQYIVGQDYFQARIADLRNYGLDPQLATAEFPQEVFLRACAVLARKRSAA